MQTIAPKCFLFPEEAFKSLVKQWVQIWGSENKVSLAEIADNFEHGALSWDQTCQVFPC